MVRLKGGDPAIFGRITEEVQTLENHHIHYEIVPGVTSASAAVATMNMGLTMRSIAPSVTSQLVILKIRLITIRILGT